MNSPRFPFSQLPRDLLCAPYGAAVPAEWIDVRGIDEIDSAYCRRVENCVALSPVALEAEGHGAEAQTGDGEAAAAELHVLHG